jgi:hypothetical protein
MSNCSCYHIHMGLLQVSITKEQHKQLKQLALDNDTSIAELVRTWIEQITKAVSRAK